MSKKINGRVSLLLAAAFILLLGSCSRENKQTKEEEEEIEKYLASHPDEVYTQTSSGLYYLQILEGTGIMPVLGDSVFVKYTGMFLDGTVFDSNVDLTTFYECILGENITGFDEGVSMMKDGGKARLLIPSELAYGTTGSYPYIAGYTPLLFDIELARVVAAPAK
jgi:FKBP-type peptidyl-prolyl cis-trans isomerase